MSYYPGLYPTASKVFRRLPQSEFERLHGHEWNDGSQTIEDHLLGAYSLRKTDSESGVKPKLDLLHFPKLDSAEAHHAHFE